MPLSASRVRALVGLGSNLERSKNLRLGVAELRERFGPLQLSPVYRNPAVGFDGPDFYNLVAAFDTDRAPDELVAVFEDIHRRAGRDRRRERLSSRTLDIDLLLYGDCVQDEPPLPRDDVLEYAFVLKPLVDIAPELRHPVSGRTLLDHWRDMLASGEPVPLSRIDLDLEPAG